jgi:hypothetical protein
MSRRRERSESSGDESWSPSEEGAEVPIPTAFTVANLFAQVRLLQQEVAELQAERSRSLEALPAETFRALTGFPNLAVAREEYEKAGGDAVFGAVRRRVVMDRDVLEKAAAHVAEQFPGCGEAVEAAKQAVLARFIDSERPKDTRGRKAEVEPFSAFLLVFMYVFGGQLEFMAPILPGIHCSKGHFSRLLDIFAPVVEEKWTREYYKKRDVNWLLQNAGPNQERSKYAGERRYDNELREADVVLELDGGTMKCEKSRGLREQKENYDWSKDDQPEIRVLILSALSGEIVELSTATGGRSFECELAERMDFLERWNEGAAQLQRCIKIHLIVDRGFHDFQQAIEKKKWSNLHVSVAKPSFLNAIKHRGEHYTAEEKKSKRTNFDAEEAERNREIAGERWVNEWSVGALKGCRLFKRLLDLSIVPHMNEFLSIAAAIVNFRVRKLRESHP